MSTLFTSTDTVPSGAEGWLNQLTPGIAGTFVATPGKSAQAYSAFHPKLMQHLSFLFKNTTRPFTLHFCLLWYSIHSQTFNRQHLSNDDIWRLRGRLPELPLCAVLCRTCAQSYTHSHKCWQVLKFEWMQSLTLHTHSFYSDLYFILSWISACWFSGRWHGQISWPTARFLSVRELSCDCVLQASCYWCCSQWNVALL